MYFYLLDLELTNGLPPMYLIGCMCLAVFSGVLVITTKNPIVSVLFLISLFLVISINLIMVGLHFIGLAYLLVYVGAISILFLFVLMLINIRISELSSYTSNSIPLAFIFSVILFNIINYSPLSAGFDLNSVLNAEDILLSTSHKWDGILTNSSHITSMGNVIYTSYAPWLIVTGYILLLAMVGCIIITVKRSPSEAPINSIDNANYCVKIKKHWPLSAAVLA